MKNNNNNNNNIGYTSGTFDLIHIGHINILRNCKAMCDKLILGISTDTLVRRTKHKNPVYTQRDRMGIVRAMTKYVDIVVSQETNNKYEIWKKLKFDILFVGDDHQNKTRWKEYERKLKKVGVKIIYFPYTEGVSSSKIKNEIAKSL